MLRPSITPESLRSALDKEQQERGLSAVHDRRTLRAASAALAVWLGRQWLRPRLASHEFFNPKPLGLKTDPFMRQAAVIHLAEMLLNMQHVEGVEHVVKRISRGQRIVDDVAELAGAALLQRAGIQYRFVRPTGKKRVDYDVEAAIGGQRVCFEMKGKVADPGTRTVVATLLGAAEQLPLDTPNVVLLQPPNDWVIREDGFNALTDGIEEFFRKSDCVARVVIHADEWRTLQQEGLAELGAVVRRRSVVYVNPNAAIPFPESVASTAWLEETGKDWLGLDEVVAAPDRLARLLDIQNDFQAQLRSELQRDRQSPTQPIRSE